MAVEHLRLWTIGHSTRPLQELAALLQQHRIQTLCDVRHFPGSRRYPHFNREALERSLPGLGMRYIHLPELGGRRRARPDSRNSLWRNASFRGYADYMETPPFHEGVQRLLDLARAGRTAMMCSEAVWWRCHRALISDFLKAGGTRVTHIVGPGRTQDHAYTSPARLVRGRLTYSPRRVSRLKQ